MIFLSHSCTLRMAWQGLTQSINIGSTSMFIKLNLRFLLNQIQTWQDPTRSTCRSSTNNQILQNKQIRDMPIISPTQGFLFILEKLYIHFHVYTGFEKRKRFLFKRKHLCRQQLTYRLCGVGPSPKLFWQNFPYEQRRDEGLIC